MRASPSTSVVESGSSGVRGGTVPVVPCESGIHVAREGPSDLVVVVASSASHVRHSRRVGTAGVRGWRTEPFQDCKGESAGMDTEEKTVDAEDEEGMVAARRRRT